MQNYTQKQAYLAFFVPVSFFVVTTFTGDLAFTARANLSLRWLRRVPVLRGLVCFFGSAMEMFSSIRFLKLGSIITLAGHSYKVGLSIIWLLND